MATNLDVVVASKLELAVTPGLYVNAATVVPKLDIARVPNLNIPVLPEIQVAWIPAVYMKAVTNPSAEIPGCKEMAVIPESYVGITTAEPELDVAWMIKQKESLVPEMEVPVIPNLYVKAIIDQIFKLGKATAIPVRGKAASIIP